MTVRGGQKECRPKVREHPTDTQDPGAGPDATQAIGDAMVGR